MDSPNNQIVLTGRLICSDTQEADIVREHLQQHIHLTRSEPGCLLFSVEQSDNPLIWTVHEIFTDHDAFETHQARVRASAWGKATSSIARDYSIT